MALAMAPAEYTMADPGNGYVIHIFTSPRYKFKYAFDDGWFDHDDDDTSQYHIPYYDSPRFRKEFSKLLSLSELIRKRSQDGNLDPEVLGNAVWCQHLEELMKKVKVWIKELDATEIAVNEFFEE